MRVYIEAATHIDKSQSPASESEGFPPVISGSAAAAPRLEPFVDAQTVAEFLSLRRPEVLKLTRERKIRGYVYRGRQRHVYRFCPSEVSEDFEKLAHATIPTAAHVSQRRKSSNG